MSEGYCVFTPKELRAHEQRVVWRGLLVGILLGLLLAGGVVLYTASTWAETIDERMERACSWPTREGEFLGVAVLQGKIVCWVLE